LGNLATPKSVQKLQTALHAKAKAEAGYRFYALYDNLWSLPPQGDCADSGGIGCANLSGLSVERSRPWP
jgi:hypothetical protein